MAATPRGLAANRQRNTRCHSGSGGCGARGGIQRENLWSLIVSRRTAQLLLAWKHNEGELKDVKYKTGADPTGKLARMFGVYL